MQEDGEVDELRVLANQLFDLELIEIHGRVVLHVQRDFRTTAQWFTIGIFVDGERLLRARLPHVLLVVVVFRRDRDTVGDEVGRVEAHAELADEVRAVGLVLRGLLQEGLGATLRNRAQVLDEFLTGHAHAGVDDLERVGGLVRAHTHLELRVALLLAELLCVGDGEVANLVKRVRCVGNQFSQEDVLI